MIRLLSKKRGLMWVEREEILMFSDSDISCLKRSSYTILQMNHHDVTLHSRRTGHDWIIISRYDSAVCCIRHRHSQRDPYHEQKGLFKSLKAALAYIDRHEAWFAIHKMPVI